MKSEIIEISANLERIEERYSTLEVTNIHKQILGFRSYTPNPRIFVFCHTPEDCSQLDCTGRVGMSILDPDWRQGTYTLLSVEKARELAEKIRRVADSSYTFEKAEVTGIDPINDEEYILIRKDSGTLRIEHHTADNPHSHFYTDWIIGGDCRNDFRFIADRLETLADIASGNV